MPVTVHAVAPDCASRDMRGFCQHAQVLCLVCVVPGTRHTADSFAEGKLWSNSKQGDSVQCTPLACTNHSSLAWKHAQEYEACKATPEALRRKPDLSGLAHQEGSSRQCHPSEQPS